jgi:putative ABC transport system ATP-binding protein
VALARALVKRPKVLLLDEHTASLDPSARKSVLSLTTDLTREYGLTTLAVTHNLSDAIDFGSRLLVLHEGRVLLDVSGRTKTDSTPEQLMHLFRELAGALRSDSGLVFGTPENLPRER